MSSPYPCKVCGLYFHYELDMYACRACYHALKIQEYNSPSHWVNNQGINQGINQVIHQGINQEEE